MCMGFGTQCRRDHWAPHHRLTEGTSDRHDYEQLCPMQWPFPDHDCHHHHVFVGSAAGAFSSVLSVRNPGGSHRARRAHDASDFKDFIGYRVKGRALLLHAGTAAIPEAADWKGHRPLHFRQNLIRTGPRHRGGGTGRSDYLADGEHLCGDATLLAHCSGFLDPFARVIGMDGVILLAFILGFPANEIVVPIIIMAYLAEGSLLDISDLSVLRDLLVSHGWTWITAVSTMLFSLMHWPCSTTCLTIKKDTECEMDDCFLPGTNGYGNCRVFLFTTAARMLV